MIVMIALMCMSRNRDAEMLEGQFRQQLDRLAVSLGGMKVVSGLVTALMLASRAGHDVVSIKNAFAFSQIGKEENGAVTLIAGDDDIPRAVLGFYHGGPAFCRGWDLVQARKLGSVSVL